MVDVSKAKILEQSKEILFFAHHPPCDQFVNHTIPFFGKHWCIGCFIGYPAAIFGIILYWLLSPVISSLWQSASLWILITVLFLLSFLVLLSFFLPEYRILKILKKAILGLTLGVFIGALWDSLPFYSILKIFVVGPAIGITLFGLEKKHKKNTQRICIACDLTPDHPQCPLKELITPANPFSLQIVDEFSVLENMPL